MINGLDQLQLPVFSDIEDAAKRLQGLAAKTPLLEYDVLNKQLGARIFIKPEVLQLTGSFKFRGAYNCISRVQKDQAPGGIITCSSGNHAQGVAEAARLCNLPSKIVMPADAPAIKRQRTERSGAVIVPYDRETEDREQMTADLAAADGSLFVPPYDDPYIVAGQGTVGLEMAEQVGSRTEALDIVLVPVGGGGLISGVSLALKHLWPDVAVYSVEPENFDDTARSIAAGERMKNKSPSGSICDALLATAPGELTFEIIKKHVSGGLVISDADVCEAMRYAFRELKLVVEPGGAITLAALLSGQLDVADKRVGIVLSGGNVDPEAYAKIICSD